MYTDKWDGSEWKGNSFNILTFIVCPSRLERMMYFVSSTKADKYIAEQGALFILTPVLGLAFAYFSYGILWG